MDKNKYNGYTNYITFRVMHDYLDDLVDMTTDETYFNETTIEKIVREKIYLSYHNITRLNHTGCNIWDYAMYAIIDVDWGDLAAHVNNDINQKLND